MSGWKIYCGRGLGGEQGEIHCLPSLSLFSFCHHHQHQCLLLLSFCHHHQHHQHHQHHCLLLLSFCHHHQHHNCHLVEPPKCSEFKSVPCLLSELHIPCTNLNCILQDLFGDTPLDHIWRDQI